MTKITSRILLLSLMLLTFTMLVKAQDTDGDGIPNTTEYNFNATRFALDFSGLTRGTVGSYTNIINSNISNKQITATSKYSYVKFSTSYSNNFQTSGLIGGAINSNPSGNTSGDFTLGVEIDPNTTITNYKTDWEQIVINFDQPVKVTISPKSVSTFGGAMDANDHWTITTASGSNMTATGSADMTTTGSGTNTINLIPASTVASPATATGWSVTTDGLVTQITLRFYTDFVRTNRSPLNISVDIPRDFDTDGTPDYKDLDSDDDGCSDQSEIAATSYYNTSVKSCITSDVMSVTKGTTSTASALNNDLSSTGAQATATNAKTTATGTWPTGVTLNSDGTITVTNAATPGTYNNLTYTLCSPPTGTPQFCTSSTINLTVEVNLPVTFGGFSASININGQINIDWSTLTEKNFDHFIVEVSNDGVNWKVLDKVSSKSLDGNSDKELKYSLTKSLSGTSSLFGVSFSSFGLLMMILLGIGLTISSISRRKYASSVISLLLAISLIGTVASCKKDTDATLVDGKSKLFVRITTVDKDGKTEVSKVIQAVQE